MKKKIISSLKKLKVPTKQARRHWADNVKTVSTFPPPNTFNQTADKIVEIMADPKVSPLGFESARKMVQYHLNRGGKGIPLHQQIELKKAAAELSRMAKAAKKK